MTLHDLQYLGWSLSYSEGSFTLDAKPGTDKPMFRYAKKKNTPKIIIIVSHIGVKCAIMLIISKINNAVNANKAIMKI